MAKGEIFCVFEHFHDNTLEKKKIKSQRAPFSISHSLFLSLRTGEIKALNTSMT